jgi:arsenite methyltransferase
VPAKFFQNSAMLYAGCIAGAVQHDDYLKIIEETGFKNIELKKTKTVDIPDEILRFYLSDTEIKRYREKSAGIFSITVTADK